VVEDVRGVWVGLGQFGAFGMSAVGEVALDVFDDDDGVVYHEAGRERDAEEVSALISEAKI